MVHLKWRNFPPAPLFSLRGQWWRLLMRMTCSTVVNTGTHVMIISLLKCLSGINGTFTGFFMFLVDKSNPMFQKNTWIKRHKALHRRWLCSGKTILLTFVVTNWRKCTYGFTKEIYKRAALVPPTGHIWQKQKELAVTLIGCTVCRLRREQNSQFWSKTCWKKQRHPAWFWVLQPGLGASLSVPGVTLLLNNDRAENKPCLWRAL